MVSVRAEIPWTELEDHIRHVRLLLPRNDAIVYPYLDAEISLQEVAYEHVRPTSLYVLRANLALQKQLALELAPAYHPLSLEGGLTLLTEDGAEVGLIPPIVEETVAEGQYILDGLHRTMSGRIEGMAGFVAIHISGFREDCPAAALPNTWDEVVMYDSTPTDPALKRRYRSDPLTLRRDFSALNGSTPRW